MFHEIYMMQNTVVLSLYPFHHLLLFPCQFMGLGWGLEAGYNVDYFMSNLKMKVFKEALTYQ